MIRRAGDLEYPGAESPRVLDEDLAKDGIDAVPEPPTFARRNVDAVRRFDRHEDDEVEAFDRAHGTGDPIAWRAGLSRLQRGEVPEVVDRAPVEDDVARPRNVKCGDRSF